MAEFAWYYAKNGQQIGPVALEVVSELIRSGKLSAGDLVWTAGMEQWQPALTVPHFEAVCARAAATAPFPVVQPAGAGDPYQQQPVANYAQPEMLSYGHQIPYAGFWLRFVALVIDWIVLFALSCVAALPLGVLMRGVTGLDGSRNGSVAAAEGVLAILLQLIYIAIPWLYFALMESSTRQATLGKMAVGIYVTDLNGNRVSFGRATGRYFAKWISGVILCIGFIMAAFTERKQALHDIIASTLVVRK